MSLSEFGRGSIQKQTGRARGSESLNCFVPSAFLCRKGRSWQRTAALSNQVSSSCTDLAELWLTLTIWADRDLCASRRELQDLQCLYRQSVEHAGEQAQLIQQLEGLNLDTQRVLRSQEEAHTADTVSYQKVQERICCVNLAPVLTSERGAPGGVNLCSSKDLTALTELVLHCLFLLWQLYSELSVSYQALWHSQEQLRQREAALSMQLSQRDQQIQELQAQLQSFTAAAGHCEVSPCGEHHDRFTSCSMPFVCKASWMSTSAKPHTVHFLFLLLVKPHP